MRKPTVRAPRRAECLPILSASSAASANASKGPAPLERLLQFLGRVGTRNWCCCGNRSEDLVGDLKGAAASVCLTRWPEAGEPAAALQVVVENRDVEESHLQSQLLAYQPVIGQSLVQIQECGLGRTR